MAATKMTTVSGRILNENGRPLVGATVLDKTNGRGVSTDAEGHYSLAVPANRASNLQVGYGGYSEEELHVQVKGYSVQNVTLLPHTDKPAKANIANFDIETAAAYNTEVLKAKLKAKLKAIAALKLNQTVQDILLTLTDQLHLLKLSPKGDQFVYLAVNSRDTNLAQARQIMKAHSVDLL